MVKVFLASFNRASDGALSKLKKKLIEEDMWASHYRFADYILACGDRKETFEFVLKRFQENMPIIHLWAGEISQGTHDEVYRHAMTIMSIMQLCTNKRAQKRVQQLCKVIGKVSYTVVVGNVMLDNMVVDESEIPEYGYDLILYNPPTRKNSMREELTKILNLINGMYIWIEPNGDAGSEEIQQYVNTKNLPREKFLGLLKNCNRFITNSSCQFYEAPFLMDKENIISIGIRNKERESKYADMSIEGASDKIMEVFKTAL